MFKSLSKELFIAKARIIFGEKYDYSLVQYTHSKNKIIIICPEHGEFEQKPNSHLNGYGCRLCGLKKVAKKQQLDQKDFIDRASKTHNNKYNYSLTEYLHSKKKIKIICPEHGEFEQSPNSHLMGSECPACGRIKANNQTSSNKKEFINRSEKKHGYKYDYTLTEYSNSKNKIKIICPIHGIFNQTPNAHLRGSGCPACGIVTRNKRLYSTTEKFIDKSLKIHGDKYDYSLADYKHNGLKIKIICRKHGVFEQKANSHLNGFGCPTCMESHGEHKVALFLNLYKIIYERQKKFERCKNINLLSFDFYLPTLNICIEYDGKQHFSPCDYFGGVEHFEKTKLLDI